MSRWRSILAAILAVRPARRPLQPRPRRYKYQALVTMDSPGGSVAEYALPGPTCRMVVRAEHPVSHRGQLFSAMVSTSDGSTPRPGDRAVRLTMFVLGDDVARYLEPGERFVLWRGHDVGHGVVCRRVFT